MKHTLKYVLLLLVAAGCGIKNGEGNIEKKIEAKADECKNKPDCTVKIADVTSFKWDTVYVFNYVVTKGAVENAISTEYPDYQPGTRPLIFVKDGKIVYSENNPDGLLKGSAGQPIFNYSLGLKHGTYTVQNAVFKVKIESIPGKTFYQLYY